MINKKNSKPVKKSELSYGERLRRLRKEKKVTLEELAEKADLSPSFISLVERRKAVPSILSLINLAKALEVDINYFIAPPTTSNIFHSAKKPEYLDIDSPVSFIRLSANHPGQVMDSYIFEIPPGPVWPREKRRGECFYYQLEGRLHFEVGDEVFTTDPGDSLHFNSEHGFTVQNKGEKPAKVLWVGTPVLFPNND